MDLTLVNTVAPLGLGGVIAIIMLIWKRADDQRNLAREQQISGQLLNIVQANTAAVQQLTAAVSGQLPMADLNERVRQLEGKRSRAGQ